MFLSWC